MRTLILFLATLVVLVAGALTVVASPTYKLSAARPTPSPLFVVGNPPPTPSPTPEPTPTPTAAPVPNGTVAFYVPVYKQLRNLDCETAALQMALGALGINYTQNQLIAMQPPPDTRSPVMGRLANGQKVVVQWGNPYKNFVGNIDGADLIPTGYGIYYPPLLALVQSHGVPNAEGGEGWTAAKIYADLAAGHPVMAWTETGWDRPYVGYWTTFDEKIKIRYSLIEHVVTLSGVSATQVRVNDPWHSGSQYWFSKAEFERSWADFNNMAIVFK
ncbi:MAG TPA: C39 family peptidase [Candidatus Dormibacteraeota bacterium]|nr:C39 family peptidase [Candidatus Dormibacteraeota bacterium]